MPSRTLLPALKITLIYLVVAALWIVLSDRAMDLLIEDHDRYMVMQTWKGWFFVAVTAGMLFLLVRSAMARLRNEMLKQQSLVSELAANRSAQAQLLEVLDDVAWMREVNGGRYLFLSPAIEHVYGVTAETFTQDGDYWFNCIHPEDRAIPAGKRVLLESQGWAEFEYRIIRPDKEVRWIRDRTHLLRDGSGHPHRLIGIASDITLQRQHAERIHRLANYESLTGLPNRAMVDELVRVAIAEARLNGHRVGVIDLDIRSLKDINDSYGYTVGDEVLRGCAERLRSVLGSGENIADLGAGEFAVILPGLADGAQAAIIGQRMLDELARPLTVSAGEIRIGATLGISLFPADAETPIALLQTAGLALHDAKARGPGQMSFYQPAMNASVAERVALVADLHLALEHNQLELHYQPQICLTSGRVIGVEALMRWRHPQRGLVSPAQFIPLAEANGMIVAMGAWALHEACRQCRAWQQAGLPPVVVAVNISALQFRSSGLRDTAAAALAAAGLEPRWLELEVTESVIMDGAERMLDVLAELRALGVQLSIDDFGTGYSSLAYLTRFAVNKLKIDQAFVRGALLRERDAAIVGIIVQMAKLMHLRVIAEGVETAEQVLMLKHHGCDEAQGFHYARPMPAEQLEDFMRERSAA
jgi:diguanylate cyclase (GGDEF)-like protein/PAS domain S-box-containing protein